MPCCNLLLAFSQTAWRRRPLQRNNAEKEMGNEKRTFVFDSARGSAREGDGWVGGWRRPAEEEEAERRRKREYNNIGIKENARERRRADQDGWAAVRANECRSRSGGGHTSERAKGDARRARIYAVSRRVRAYSPLSLLPPHHYVSHTSTAAPSSPPLTTHAHTRGCSSSRYYRYFARCDRRIS